ncbi:hypothetical protein TNCV_2328081 [Trichonephila clavipes]|nr:hypothetical protein TNCV_2328081 [Trichonephila clavipes]
MITETAHSKSDPKAHSNRSAVEGMPDEQALQFAAENNAKGLWDKIRAIFIGRGEGRKIDAGNKLKNIVMKNGETVGTATAGSDVVQSGRPIFDDFFQHLWPSIGNNTANVVFQMVKRLWLIRIDQLLYIAPQKKV